MEPSLANIARAPIELEIPIGEETVFAIKAVADASGARGGVFLVARTTGELFCRGRANTSGMEWLLAEITLDVSVLRFLVKSSLADTKLLTGE